MATVEENIFNGLFEAVRAWTLPAGWTWNDNVAKPGIAYSPVTDRPFMEFGIIFNASEGVDIAQELDPIRRGILLTAIKWPKGQGHLAAVAVAASLRLHFKRGTKIIEDGTEIRIDNDPEFGTIFPGATHETVPLTIPWVVYP